MKIELINFGRIKVMCQWWFAILTIELIDNTDDRSLFYVGKDYNEYYFSILFINFKIEEE